MARIWNASRLQNFNDRDLLDNITEPTLYIQTLLARFRRHVDSGEDNFIKEKRCGCKPPCKEHQLRLVNLSKGEKADTDYSPTVYSLKVREIWVVVFEG